MAFVDKFKFLVPFTLCHLAGFAGAIGVSARRQCTPAPSSPCGIPAHPFAVRGAHSAVYPSVFFPP
eukprot:COSAG01_NODE_10411_length_2173_cov_1.449373_4_plen_66_part_00